MFNRKTILTTAIVAAMGGVSFSASAALTSTATLDFTLGTVGADAGGCTYGTTPPCNNKAYNISDIVGSYFSMDTGGNGQVEPNEKTPIGSLNGIVIGTTQAAGGSHSGAIDGTESPNIDNPWTFFGGTGMHQTTGAAVDNGDGTITLPWTVAWNGIANIPLTPTSATTLVCDTATCSNSSNYTIDGAFHVAGAGFTTVGYTVHLEGHINQQDGPGPGPTVPVPAAAWLFGSGLIGLAGVARRRKSKK